MHVCSSDLESPWKTGHEGPAFFPRISVHTLIPFDVERPDPCGLRGCKNRPAPFPGWMSYKPTKPGSVCTLSWPRVLLNMCDVLLTRASLYVVIFCVICVFCPLVVLVRLPVPVQVIDWKDSSPKWPIVCWWGR